MKDRKPAIKVLKARIATKSQGATGFMWVISWEKTGIDGFTSQFSMGTRK